VAGDHGVDLAAPGRLVLADDLGSRLSKRDLNGLAILRGF